MIGPPRPIKERALAKPPRIRASQLWKQPYYFSLHHFHISCQGRTFATDTRVSALFGVAPEYRNSWVMQAR